MAAAVGTQLVELRDFAGSVPRATRIEELVPSDPQVPAIGQQFREFHVEPRCA